MNFNIRGQDKKGFNGDGRAFTTVYPGGTGSGDGHADPRLTLAGTALAGKATARAGVWSIRVREFLVRPHDDTAPAVL